MRKPPLFDNGKIIRPAMLEVGVADQPQLAKTMAFYELLLGDTTYPFPLAGDMALLCRATEDGSTNTIIYWQVAGTTFNDLQAVYEDLIANYGCQGIQPPHKLFARKTRPQSEPIATCTLADPAGNVLGLVINPPYPRIPTQPNPLAQVETISPPFPRVDAGQSEAMA